MTVGSEVKTCLATIKGIEASLSTVSIQSSNEQTKQALMDANELIAEIKSDLDKHLIMLSNEEPQYKQ